MAIRRGIFPGDSLANKRQTTVTINPKWTYSAVACLIECGQNFSKNNPEVTFFCTIVQYNFSNFCAFRYVIV
jgi:hypothetical protein